MELLFSDIPEALENNYNLVYKINYRPKFSRPILPNINSNNGSSPDEVLKEESLKGLNEKFEKLFKVSNEKLSSNQVYNEYKNRLFRLQRR